MSVHLIELREMFLIPPGLVPNLVLLDGGPLGVSHSGGGFNELFRYFRGIVYIVRLNGREFLLLDAVGLRTRILLLDRKLHIRVNLGNAFVFAID